MTAVRIGNCSGFYGDRLAAMREMLTGGELDYLTGDYLAELTMLILGRDRMKNPDRGYARTFLFQPGRCFVVGGHSRSVGKTALVVALVRAVGPRPVATVKVSAHRHGGGHFAIEEDDTPSLATSTGRCLAAGAARAFLCRCPDGQLHEVAALVRVLSPRAGDLADDYAV